MKKTILFPLLVLLTVQISAQEFQIEQITSGNFDARNPYAPKGPSYSGSIFFELHSGSSSNIAYVDYVDFTDIFMITSDGFININPTGSKGLIVFQTNRNGNWDIAYRKNINMVWGDVEYIANSTEDEINPTHFYSSEPYNDYESILFQKGDTIFSAEFTQNSLLVEPVFINSSDYSYSDYTGIVYYNFGGASPAPGYHVIAVETDVNSNRRLVSKHKPIGLQWGFVNVILDSCDCTDPTFQYINDWPINLIYEDTLNSERRLFSIKDWELNKVIDTVEISYSGNLNNFSSDIGYIVTKSGNVKQSAQSNSYPHSYYVHYNDELKIRLNLDELYSYWFNPDTLVNVSFPNSKLEVSNLGPIGLGEVIYTIWEDSSEGNIHLFGRKQIILVSSVEVESNLFDFILHQNYPNPFNPRTKIEYRILTSSDVRFEVINILGEKVFDVDFGYQSAGNYHIDFDGTKLPSGIYVYSIFAGENRLSRKMVLMR